MAKQMPPVPPASRSTKGPGSADRPSARPATAQDRAPPQNLEEQDRQGNIRQNTTHKGHQQDR